MWAYPNTRPKHPHVFPFSAGRGCQPPLAGPLFGRHAPRGALALPLTPDTLGRLPAAKTTRAVAVGYQTPAKTQQGPWIPVGSPVWLRTCQTGPSDEEPLRPRVGQPSYQFGWTPPRRESGRRTGGSGERSRAQHTPERRGTAHAREKEDRREDRPPRQVNRTVLA